MNTKRLSIIIPVYNVEKYLRTCLLSILEQAIHKSDYEIIIVNDGSTDNSIDTVVDLIHLYPLTIKLVNQSNQGLSGARNTGLNQATGKFVLFVDSDDGLVENSLPHLLKLAEQYDLDMLRFNYKKIDDRDFNTHTNITNYHKEEIKIISGQEGLLFHNTRECYVWMNLFQRDFLLSNNLYFEPNLYFEDIPFTMACYLAANRFAYFPVEVYIYRQRPYSILGSMNAEKLISLNTALKLTNGLKKKHHIPPRTLQKINDTIFDSLSMMLWYLTHYNHIFEHKEYVLSDLKQKLPNLWFDHNTKQICVSLCIRYIPLWYITLKRLFSKRRF